MRPICCSKLWESLMMVVLLFSMMNPSDVCLSDKRCEGRRTSLREEKSRFPGLRHMEYASLTAYLCYA